MAAAEMSTSKIRKAGGPVDPTVNIRTRKSPTLSLVCIGYIERKPEWTAPRLHTSWLLGICSDPRQGIIQQRPSHCISYCRVGCCLLVWNGRKKCNAWWRVRRYAAGPVTGGVGWLRWVSSYNPVCRVSAHVPAQRYVVPTRLGTTEFGCWVGHSTFEVARIGPNKGRTIPRCSKHSPRQRLPFFDIIPSCCPGHAHRLGPPLCLWYREKAAH